MKICPEEEARASAYSRFARRHGISLSPASESALLVLEKQRSGASPTDEELNAFRSGIQELERLMQPLSPDEIELLFDPKGDVKKEWFTKCLLVSLFYLFLFLTGILFLIGFQYRLQTGLGILAPLDKSITAAEAANLKIEQLSLLGDPEEENPKSGQNKETLLKRKSDILVYSTDLGKSLLEINHLKTELKTWIDETSLSFVKKIFAGRTFNPKQDDTDMDFRSQVDFLLRAYLTEANRQVIMAEKFALPSLAGFLGALVAVLRIMINEWRKFGAPISFNLIRDLLVISLGLFAGLTIGWFGSISNSGSLSPVAVSFLVGYSLEVFFDLLDRSLKPIRGAS